MARAAYREALILLVLPRHKPLALIESIEPHVSSECFYSNSCCPAPFYTVKLDFRRSRADRSLIGALFRGGRAFVPWVVLSEPLRRGHCVLVPQFRAAFFCLRLRPGARVRQQAQT